MWYNNHARALFFERRQSWYTQQLKMLKLDLKL